MTRDSTAAATLTLEAVETPLGDFLLVTDAEGLLRAAEFADCEHRLHRHFGRRLGPNRTRLVAGRVPDAIKAALAAYFAGDIAAIDGIAVRGDGTPFQESVWAALRTVRHPTTYVGLGARIGRPDAARAVGHANGANPMSIVVPCHRLVGADGALTGYGGGIARKRWLLDHEAAHAAAD